MRFLRTHALHPNGCGAAYCSKKNQRHKEGAANTRLGSEGCLQLHDHLLGTERKRSTRLLHAIPARFHAGAEGALVLLPLRLLLRLCGLLLRGLLLLALPPSTDCSHHATTGSAHRSSFSRIASNRSHGGT